MQLTEFRCPEPSGNNAEQTELHRFMSSFVTHTACWKEHFYFLAVLVVSGFKMIFFPNLWPVRISQTAQPFQALPGGKELWLSIQKLLSVRSHTRRGFLTAALDGPKALPGAAVSTMTLLLTSEIKGKKRVCVLHILLCLFIASCLLCPGSNTSGRRSGWACPQMMSFQEWM